MRAGNVFNDLVADGKTYGAKDSSNQLKDTGFEASIVRWLNDHPAPSPPGHCASCTKPGTPDRVLLPYGTEPGTHTSTTQPGVLQQMDSRRDSTDE
jgi:hypothetical protein